MSNQPQTIAQGKRPTDTITVAGSRTERIGHALDNLANTITPTDLATNARELRRHADELEYAAVIIARQDGQSWELIGRMLNISRQAAHKAYAHRLPTSLA